MKHEKQKLSLETFEISKLTNLKSVWGGNDDHTIKVSSRECRNDD